MKDINYKPLIFKKLAEFKDHESNMTMGEILYSFLRPKISKHGNVESIKWLREISDRKLHNAMEKAQTIEEND